MVYKIRANRDVTQKGPEGSGTRRRTIKLPGGPTTLVIGAQPIYLRCDALPPEIEEDQHLLAQEIPEESLDPEIIVIDLKAERVQEELTAAPGGAELKPERVQQPVAKPPARGKRR